MTRQQLNKNKKDRKIELVKGCYVERIAFGFIYLNTQNLG